MEPAGVILTVDTHQEHLDSYRFVLAQTGFKVFTAPDQSGALESAERAQPDIIVLDTDPGDQSGLNVLVRLKESPTFSATPVLMLTDRDDPKTTIKALELGADDCLEKPFPTESLKARVRNLVDLKKSRDLIRQQRSAIAEMEEAREEMLHMIVHDLKSPLSGINGFLQLIQLRSQEIQDTEIGSYVENCLESVKNLSSMINSILEVSLLEAGKISLEIRPVNASSICREAANSQISLAQARNLTVGIMEASAEVACDPSVIQRVIALLMANALQYSPKDREIRIEIQSQGEWVRISVLDEGRLIPKEFHDRIFKRFSKELKRKTGLACSGLGLAFCKLAVEAHGGTIGLENLEEQGNRFWLTLPSSERRGQ